MKSKIRLLTILFSIAMLIAFGVVPYMVFIKKGVDSLNVFSALAIVMLLLFLTAVFAIFWMTLIVKVDKESKTIKFTYLFRFKSTTINFENIVGFRYKYLSGRIQYKALQIKTYEGKYYTFSDFETSNLRDFEKEFIEIFELKNGKNFNKLNKKQIDSEIEFSKSFDYEQAKEIRFTLCVVIILIALILLKFINKIIVNNDNNFTASIITIIITVIVLFFILKKLIRTNDIIKNGA